MFLIDLIRSSKYHRQMKKIAEADLIYMEHYKNSFKKRNNDRTMVSENVNKDRNNRTVFVNLQNYVSP